MITEVKCQTCFAPLRLAKQREVLVTCPYCGADNVLPRSLQTVTRVNAKRFATILYRFIAEEFNLSGMQNLVMELNCRLVHASIDYEDLAGQTRKVKAMELVKWCQRYDELETLIDVVQTLRPSANTQFQPA